MQPRRSLPAAVLAALMLAVPVAVAADDSPVDTVRPTGVGLPIIGSGQDVQAGDTPAMVAWLRQYHDSGQYGRDRRKVARAARSSLLSQLAALPAGVKPAIVLDIDETSLSNWATLDAGDFGGKPVPEKLANAPDPAIKPTLRIFKLARARHVAVFFITGRGPSARPFTQRNLRSVGFTGWTNAYFRPSNAETIPFKSGTRAKIERRGYTILINVGDQQSDLQGGHAVRAFKYPNPFYFIG